MPFQRHCLNFSVGAHSKLMPSKDTMMSVRPPVSTAGATHEMIFDETRVPVTQMHGTPFLARARSKRPREAACILRAAECDSNDAMLISMKLVADKLRLRTSITCVQMGRSHDPRHKNPMTQFSPIVGKWSPWMSTVEPPRVGPKAGSTRPRLCGVASCTFRLARSVQSCPLGDSSTFISFTRQSGSVNA